jgi:hypothetical protein
LLRVNRTRESGPPGKITVEAADCVFDLVGPHATALPQSALVEVVAPFLPSDLLDAIEVVGDDSLAGPDLLVGALAKPADGALVPLPADAIRLEGITTGPFRFAGPADEDPASSVIADYNAPRRSPDPPGVDATKLPKTPHSAKVSRTK